MPILTINVDDELFDQFTTLAKDMESTVEQCHLWALQDFLAEERPNVDGMLEGMKDIEEGRFVTQEQMEEWAASLKTANPLPLPEPVGLPVTLAS